MKWVYDYLNELEQIHVTHPARDDLLVNLNGLVSEEGRVAGRHLVHQDPEGPPVDSFVVTLE